MQRTLLVLALIGAASAANEDLIGALNGDLGLGEHFVPLSGETAESLWTATQAPPTPSAAPATQSGGAGYSVSLVASAASAAQSGDTVDRVALVRRRRSGAPGQPLAAGETDLDRLAAALGQPLAAAETVPTAAPPMLPAAAAAPVTPTNIGAAHLGQPLAAGTPAKAAPAAVALAGVMPQAVAQSVAKAAAVPQFHPGHFAWSIAEIKVRREPSGNFRHLLSVDGREVSNKISANVPELLIGSTIFDYDAGTLDGVELPRAEILKNAFVLRPLADIAPDELHPVCRESYRSLWKSYQKDQKLWPVDFTWQGRQISSSGAVAE